MHDLAGFQQKKKCPARESGVEREQKKKLATSSKAAPQIIHNTPASSRSGKIMTTGKKCVCVCVREVQCTGRETEVARADKKDKTQHRSPPPINSPMGSFFFLLLFAQNSTNVVQLSCSRLVLFDEQSKNLQDMQFPKHLLERKAANPLL